METRSDQVWVRPNADEWKIMRSLREELGLDISNILRLGLRALVSVGMSTSERSLLKRRHSFVPSTDHKINFKPKPADWKIVASLREDLGQSVASGTIARLGIRALARKERMVKERLAAQKQAPTTRDYIALEPKACESCRKTFLRVIGGGEIFCSACEVRIATAERASMMSLAAARLDLLSPPRRPMIAK
jgi:hypothetical protein